MSERMPGATLGILGGGQLALMMAVEARRMGYRIAVLDPSPEAPAVRLADVHVAKAWDSVDGALQVARVSDVVTLDTEHIPADALDEVEKVCPVLPAPSVLRTVQDRLLQKEFLEKNGFPSPAFAPVDDAATLDAAVEKLQAPLVLKARKGGFDGRGTAFVRRADEAPAAFARLGKVPCIAEAFVAFDREVSVVLARDGQGHVASYPVVENVHRDGILHASVAPARIPEADAAEARSLAERIAVALDHVGVLAVEIFHTREGDLLVNELAPRVHNSGHLTLGPAVTSQFEQHVRAVLGLPLGDATLREPSAMLNLLGDLWAKGEPDWRPVHATPRAALHLYGKKPRPARKVGHVTVSAPTADASLEEAQRLYALLAEAP